MTLFQFSIQTVPKKSTSIDKVNENPENRRISRVESKQCKHIQSNASWKIILPTNITGMSTNSANKATKRKLYN